MSMALKGLNLGGWLVAERWMTKDLFTGVYGEGERAIGLSLGNTDASKRLTEHRDTFICEADFEWISRNGFSFVRLPVGYWLFEETVGYVSGEVYVSKAFEWAEKHGLGVILDLHGLPGSQNGQDHSGEAGAVGFYKHGMIDKALFIIERIVVLYGNKSSLIGIEIINEPKLPILRHKLLTYYQKAYQIIDARAHEDVKVIISDAFKPLKMCEMIQKYHFGYRLVLDVHLYQLFSPQDISLRFEQHLEKVNTEWASLLQTLSSKVHVLVGEWTPALPNNAVKGMESESALKQFFDAQKKIYDTYAWAECMWSYKALDSLWWSYKDLPFISEKRK